MSKKNAFYVIIGVFVFVLILSLVVSNNADSVETATEDMDSSYYVEANNNIFIRFSNICDDCCYYIVDMVLGGIENIFSSFTKN